MVPPAIAPLAMSAGIERYWSMKAPIHHGALEHIELQVTISDGATKGGHGHVVVIRLSGWPRRIVAGRCGRIRSVGRTSNQTE